MLVEEGEKGQDEKKEKVEKNLKRQKRNQEEKQVLLKGGDVRQARKQQLQKQLNTTRQSTASMGLFDKQFKGDKQKVKRTKIVDEQKEQREVLDKMEKGVKVNKRKAVKLVQ